MLKAVATRLHGRVEFPILTQRSMPKARLLEAFAADPATCLFATMGFWQGVDVPGSRSASWSSTASRSPAPTSRCCRPAGSEPAPTPSAASTCPAPPRSSPRAPAA